MRIAISGRVAACHPVCDSPATSQDDLIALYLLTLAPSSRRTMRRSLDVVADIALPGAKASTFEWGGLSYQTVVRVRAALASRYAPATANKCLAAMRGVLRQAMLSERLTRTEYEKCISIRAVRGSATSAGRCIPAAELRSMMLASARCSAFGARDEAMIALLYGCGLRRSELVELDLADYDHGARALNVMGKGQKQRVVFVNSMVVSALARWLEIRGQTPGPFFVRITQAGRLQNKVLSAQAVYRLTARVARVARVTRPSPHDFRRSFVSDLLDRGADLSVVQKLVGHASPVTTCRYDRRAESAQRRAVELLCVSSLA